MQSARFYRIRADLAYELAAKPENATLRAKYMALWKQWSDLADKAEAALGASCI